jgi:hypothetical protein
MSSLGLSKFSRSITFKYFLLMFFKKTSMETWSQSETPPELLPAGGQVILANSFSPETTDVLDLLLRILSRLTVYQSLPDNPGLILSVRADVSMLDACCLFMPNQCSTTVIEVLEEPVNGTAESPTSRANKLLELAAGRSDDVNFSKALEAEATRVTSAFAADAENVDPIGEFLSIHDAFFFLKKVIVEEDTKVVEMTVRDWIELKQAITYDGGDAEWIRFCETSVLVRRASLNLAQGVGHNQVISGSSMNLSQSNLMSSENGSFNMKQSKSGGSCLAAVNELLARPWQASLPLTVCTEKGLTAVFGYTTLKQLMAHVAMNCSDRRLEPFFSTIIEFDALLGDAKANLDACSFLDYDTASIRDAIEVLASYPLSILVSGRYQTFHRFITPVDVCQVLGERIDSVTKSMPLASISACRLKDLDHKHVESETYSIREEYFPMSLSSLLQKLLMSKADALVILSEDDAPAGIITCKDVWAYVMQGGNASDQ